VAAAAVVVDLVLHNHVRLFLEGESFDILKKSQSVAGDDDNSCYSRSMENMG